MLGVMGKPLGGTGLRFVFGAASLICTGGEAVLTVVALGFCTEQAVSPMMSKSADKQ